MSEILLALVVMAPRSGEELIEELEARQEPRLVKALEMVAPGTALREGIDNFVHARTGGLIVIGDPDELALPLLGRDQARHRLLAGDLYQLAKMDGAIALNAERDQDHVGERPADAGPDDPLARRPAPATAPPSASPSRPTRS